MLHKSFIKLKQSHSLISFSVCLFFLILINHRLGFIKTTVIYPFPAAGVIINKGGLAYFKGKPMEHFCENRKQTELTGWSPKFLLSEDLKRKAGRYKNNLMP